MNGTTRTPGPRRRIVAAASIAVLAGGAVLGACAPSTSGVPCAPGDLAWENGHILRCKEGRFVAGETLEEFVRNFLHEIESKRRAKAPDDCPSAAEVGTESRMPNCPTPCADTVSPETESDDPVC